MATLIRYQVAPPTRAEFNRLFDRSVVDPAAGWTPKVDIVEYSDRFVLHADVPGVDPACIELTVEHNVLTVAGSRERPIGESEAGVEQTRIERSVGSFVRRFTLPETVDGENVLASNKNGVLEVAIPKRPTAQPRRISVTH